MSKSLKFKWLGKPGFIAELAVGQRVRRAPARNVVGLPSDCATSALSVVRTAIFSATLALAGMFGCVFAGATHASDDAAPLTIDDLGFTDVMNNNVFAGSADGTTTRTYRVQNGSLLSGGINSAPLSASSVMEIESTQRYPGGSLSVNSQESSGLVLDSRYTGLADDNQADGTVDVRRFSTSLRSSDGTLTVGNDWSNFQDFLGQTGLGQTGLSAGMTAEQLRWQPAGRFNNFSVAVESGLHSTLIDDTIDSDHDASSNLVLSWQSDPDSDSLYRVTALGSQVNLDDRARASGVEDQSGESVGWGLNLAGGWRVGDLMAAMSVTLGNSIDTFILGRLGDSKTAAAASKLQANDTSILINPSLNYQLDSQSNLHFSLNRFQTSTANAAHGVDTLDTIHVGYSWNPWPSTQLGIEFVGKDVDGRGEMDNSNAVNFAASKRF